MDEPGRSCPLHYRYSPEVFAAHVPLRAQTIYIVGGLYGNVESLRCVLAMKREEEQRTGSRVDLLFNGDFNWFDIDADSFAEINEIVLLHRALTGNVEAELGGDSDENGCGCGYPDYVDSVVVERSNDIMQRLRSQARGHDALRLRLAALPMHCSVEVGGQAIGVVHGDPESLAGWSLAWEAMPAYGREDGREDGHEHGHAHAGPERTSSGRIERYFEQARVSAFASTHTCTAFAQDFGSGAQRRLVINNGAAGMPNFKGSTFGVLTRISADPQVPANSLYGTTLGAARFDALPIDYDQAAWLARFLANWPQGSPAHLSYFQRIAQGPDFSLHQACRIDH